MLPLRGSILLWRQCNMLCTSNFVDVRLYWPTCHPLRRRMHSSGARGDGAKSVLSSIALLWNRNEHIYLGSFARVFFMTATPMPCQCQSRAGSELRAWWRMHEGCVVHLTGLINWHFVHDSYGQFFPISEIFRQVLLAVVLTYNFKLHLQLAVALSDC